MPDFDELFSEKKEKIIKYKGKLVVRFDEFPYQDGDCICVTFEKTNSEWKQGIGLDIFGFFEVNGKKYKDKIVLWEDTAPKETTMTLWKEKSKRYHPKRLPRKGFLGIRNVWDTGDGVMESWYWGAAMIIEEIQNGKRYWCNDGHPDENFDDIVFTIKKLN